jgi:hypothetical protein
MTGLTNMRFSILLVLAAVGAAQAQQPMRLTLADAQRLAIQNNPQFSAAQYTAAAANQVPRQYRAAMHRTSPATSPPWAPTTEAASRRVD